MIANGSLEHFAQPADATNGRDDAVYRHLFVTVDRLLDPAREGAKFVTTAIHFRGPRPDPRDWLKRPSNFLRDTPEFHWSRLTHAYGGWYPIRGQLEECAVGLFRLVHEEDGTDDYRRTSEECLKIVRTKLRSIRAVAVWAKAFRGILRRPIHTARMLRCMLGSESWNWQFRGKPSPTVLLRQTWERVG